MNTVESLIAVTLLYMYDDSPVVRSLALWNLRRFVLLVVVASWAINKVVVLAYFYLWYVSPAGQGDGNASWYCKCGCVSTIMSYCSLQDNTTQSSLSELVMVGTVQDAYTQVTEVWDEFAGENPMGKV